MMNWKKLCMMLLALCLTGSVGLSTPEGGAQEAAQVTIPAVLKGAVADWTVKSEDNICGVSTARQITNPAKVDYEALMGSTSEMKELKRKGIRRDSAEGQTMVTKARDKVRQAAKEIMTEKGHCSVWKKISNKKGQAVTDLTSSIKTKLGS